MILKEEELREALNNTTRLKEHAEQLKQESDLLLASMMDLLESEGPEELFTRMFKAFAGIIPFDDALILEKQNEKELVCQSSTDEKWLDSVWQIDPIFDRVLSGEAIALFDSNRHSVWQSFNDPNIASILYGPFSQDKHSDIIVFIHREKGFYIHKHIQVLERYRHFNHQIQISVNAKLRALESDKLRADKERAEASLFHAEKMASLGIMAAGVAHEINNPLSYVMSNISFIQDYTNTMAEFMRRSQVVLSERQQGSIPQDHSEQLLEWAKTENIWDLSADLLDVAQECKDGLSRVADIVDGLRNFSHQDNDSSEPLELDKCVESTLKMVNNELKYHCKVETHLTNPPPAIALTGKINQVLTNLLINAGHAIESNGLIEVSTGSKSDSQRGLMSYFSVKDNGCGIAEEKLKQIFDPFYTTKDVGKGTGLGLAISFKIVEQFNGYIDVQSTVGEGTKFTVYLPAIQA